MAGEEGRQEDQRFIGGRVEINHDSIKWHSGKKLILATLLFSEFFTFFSETIMATFFIEEAEKKGMSTSISGILFSHFSLIEFLSALFFGVMVTKVGCKLQFKLGMFFVGLCHIGFGLLVWVNNNLFFMILSFLIWTIEALGRSAYSTAALVFIPEIFPQKVGTVWGLMELAVGLGMCIGPPAGAFLFSKGGFGLPFYILGSLIVLLTPVFCFTLPSLQGRASHFGSLRKSLRIPSVIVIGLILATNSSVMSFYHVTLEPHFLCLELSCGRQAIVWEAFSVTYLIFAFIWGLVADKKSKYWMHMMITGLILTSISLFVIGPPPVLDNDTIFVMDIIGLIISSISLPLTQIPTFMAIMQCVEDDGNRRDLMNFGLVSGIWRFMFSLGEIIGPVTGGFLSEYWGFHPATTFLGFICYVTFVAALVFFLYRPLHPMTETDELQPINPI